MQGEAAFVYDGVDDGVVELGVQELVAQDEGLGEVHELVVVFDGGYGAVVEPVHVDAEDPGIVVWEGHGALGGLSPSSWHGPVEEGGRGTNQPLVDDVDLALFAYFYGDDSALQSAMG